MIHPRALLLSVVCSLWLLTTVQADKLLETRGDWAPFVEPAFPFFSSVLDLRQTGDPDNVTPRGLVLNLGGNFWACFDTELLRISAIWRGRGITPVSMSQGSYFLPGIKAPEGQAKLPTPDGEIWLWNGIYPGVHSGSGAILSDPREPGPDPREVGRGPLPFGSGRFRAIHLSQAAALHYEIRGVGIREILTSTSEGVDRTFDVQAHQEVLWLLLGKTSRGFTLHGDTNGVAQQQLQGVAALRLEPSGTARRFSAVLGPASSALELRKGSRWLQTITTQGSLSHAPNAFVTDTIALPLNNPWKRNVRIADIAFYQSGRAAVVTFDGDVWRVDGLHGELSQLTWRRFTSGLHEPLSIAIRNEELFVFDRNGVWRLRDTDNDGEADVHELLSNAFAQTAETREFAAGMRVAPDGSFVIAKGGQQTATLGRHNGSILRVSPDGASVTVLAHGLRQPFIGVHPVTGLVTASDQQGNYVPATPLHIIEGNRFYGFLPTFLPKEQYPEPIAEPLTWIPHPVNASGTSQVWLSGARMGPLNDALIHLGYYRPEAFQVMFDDRGRRTQAAVVSLTRDLPFAPLAGAINPIDGQLYLAGFQIWGTTAPQISGLARIRYTGAPDLLPQGIVAMDKGILITFSEPLRSQSALATNPANYSAESWSYRRTAEYGSPHFKADGSKGHDAHVVSSAYLSIDQRKVFVGIPGMKPVMQMRLGWALGEHRQNAYFTVYELPEFDPAANGFAPLQVDLTRDTIGAQAETPVTVAEGERLSELMGCIACHSSDGSVLGKVAPTWKGLYGAERRFAGGGKSIADENYLRESIREPSAKVVSGFEKSDTGMPSYAGVLTPDQIEALVLYIKSLSPQ